MCRLLHG